MENLTSYVNFILQQDQQSDDELLLLNSQFHRGELDEDDRLDLVDSYVDLFIDENDLDYPDDMNLELIFDSVFEAQFDNTNAFQSVR